MRVVDDQKLSEHAVFGSLSNIGERPPVSGGTLVEIVGTNILCYRFCKRRLILTLISRRAYNLAQMTAIASSVKWFYQSLCLLPGGGLGILAVFCGFGY